MRKIVPVLLLAAGSQLPVYAQINTRTAALKLTAATQAIKERTDQTRLLTLARIRNWPLTTKDRYGTEATLTSVDALGYPVYTGVYNNIISAATIGTSRLWPGGVAGLSLTGALPALKDKLVLWDGGKVRATHVEINNRVAHRDNASSLSDHSTHVAGIMMAAGVKPEVKGMAFGLSELVVYDFLNNGSEMLNESANDVLLSNHSYGTISGWYNTDGHWEFRGQAGATEDYKFGFYSEETQLWDSIVWNAPYHLIVKSAGNNRTENGPAVGQPYYRYDANNSMKPAGNRPDGIYSNDGYDILATTSTAKNILTVGAVQPLPTGYTKAAAVSVASFSSWGPTDDGRIKPDVVADGVGVFSSVSGTDNSYAALSGTSMASPATAGSLLLLQEYYASLYGGQFMHASTLKGIVIHTADEAGTAPGPDYIYGWGLINMQKAAAVITGNNVNSLIRETVLNNGQTVTIPVIASGKGTLVATLCWTDPKGTPHAIQVDNNAIKLVHDLDIRIKKGSTTYLPWILNPASPTDAAQKGDNIRDNVEKVAIDDVVPGATYTIEITHKGTLERGSQLFSLIVTGTGGAAYCNTSAPQVTTGARIDQLSFAGIVNNNTGGSCSGYADHTNFTGNIEANTTIPLSITTGACDGSNTNRIVKAFIDFNMDGDFADAGELIATSGVLAGNGVFNTNVTMPAGLTPGYYTRMRVIVEETSSDTDVQPCGSYAKGETRDYRILFATPATDAAITSLVSPLNTLCSTDAQYITVALKNNGTGSISNIQLMGTIQDDAGTVATLTGSFTPAIPAQEEIQYTFQTPFVATPGRSYTLQLTATLPGDQDLSNNTLNTGVTVNALRTMTGAQAEVCNETNVLFKSNDAGSDVFLWYDQPQAVLPVAAGSSATSSVLKPDNTWYVGRNDLHVKAGAATKTVFTEGGYDAFAGNFIRFTSYVPLTIETVKLYTGHAGKIEIIVADFGAYNGNSYTYYPISSTVIDAYATDPTPVAGTQAGNDPADQGAVFAVNLSVPAPGEHIIIIKCSDGATIFRNERIAANPYPFTIPGICSITGNSAGANNNNPTLYQQYYYFLYDMGIRLNNCPSERVPVIALRSTKPVATLNDDVLASSIATGNQWYLNGSPVNNATEQNYTPVQSGSYETIVTDVFGCASTSNKIDFTYTGHLPAIVGLTVSPNPNDGRFTLAYTVTRRADISVTIVNMLGQVIYRQSRSSLLGPVREDIYAGRLATGVYMLHVRHNKKDFTTKMIVR